jgi:Mrp family chromosome partitioning ATPase
LLSSARAREVVASIEKSSDLVLIDSPPVLPVSDALIVSGMVDATLLVASAKGSSRRALHRAVEVLRQVDASLVGTVLNNAESQETYGVYGYSAPRSNGSNGSNGESTASTPRGRRPAKRAAR